MGIEKSTNRYSIRPIPTRYDGYSLRSRLEARWAVFFKTLGLPYRYKAERLAQFTGIPAYLFYGEVRLPKENGARAKQYRVRDPWLSYQSWLTDGEQRVPSPLSISKEMQEEHGGAYNEKLKQFLAGRRDWDCENDSPRDYALACPLHGGADMCTLEECSRQQVLRRTMRRRLDEEKPLALLIEFDDSRSPDLHYWAACISYECHAIGIFPGNITHDIFCDLNCRDADDHPWAGLTSVEYENEQEYLDACDKLISSDTEELQAAYLVAPSDNGVAF